MIVCVTGSFGGGDIGDDAMVFPHLENLEQLGVKQDDIWLLGFKPAYMASHFSHPLERCLMSDLDRVPEKVLDSTDLLLVTGGGTINTRGPDGWSLKRMHRLVTSFAKRGIPVFMSGQTIGPLGIDPGHDRLAREIVETVDVLTVRDRKYSREYIGKLGAKPKRLVETVDDAADIEPGPLLPIELPEGRKIAVNITLYTFDTPAKKATIVVLCEELKRRGFGVLLVPHHPWDLEQLKTLEVPATLVDTTAWRGRTTKLLFSKCDGVVAGRYHALVFAMSAGAPCIGMAGDHYSWIKQHGFAEQFGLGDRIVPPAKVTDIRFILERLEEALKSQRKPAGPKPASFALFREWFKEKTSGHS